MTPWTRASRRANVPTSLVAGTYQKRAQGEESRDRLLAAAEDLVGAGGYAATGVDAISARAGVVKSALYWHFGSKQGLLMAALDRQNATWLAGVERAVEATSDPLERLDRLIGHVREVIVERPEARRMVFAILLERAAGDPECRAAVARGFRELRAALARGFGLAMPALEPVRALAIADAFVAHCDGLLLDHLADPDEARLDDSLRTLRRSVLLQIEHELRRTA